MPVHPVLGPDRQTLEVPAPDERLPGVRLGVAAVARGSPRPPGTAGSSWRRSRSARRRARWRRPPRRGTPRARACRGRRGRRCRPRPRWAGPRPDRRRRPARPGARRRRRRGRSRGRCRRSPRGARTTQLAVVADGPQQRHAEGTGPHPGLDDAGAGEDVGHRDDLGRVLGVDRRRRRAASTSRSRPAAGGARGTRCPRCSRPPSRRARPMRSSWASRPAWVWNSRPVSRVMVWRPALGVRRAGPGRRPRTVRAE